MSQLLQELLGKLTGEQLLCRLQLLQATKSIKAIKAIKATKATEAAEVHKSTEARQVRVYRAFCHLPWGPFCRPSPKQSCDVSKTINIITYTDV